MQKITTAKRVFSERGIDGISSVLEEKLERLLLPVRMWLGDDNWYVGKCVEISGNKVSIDGCRFSVRSPAISTQVKSRFLFDKHENFEREALRKYFDASLPVIELGGAIGVVACLTNKKMSDPRQHVVVEANPDMLPLLEENRARNGCKFTVLHNAVAYGSDEVTFHQSDDFVASSVQARAGKSVTVKAITLKELVERSGFERFALICDIEGGEIDLIERDAEVFREKVAFLLIEFHPQITGAASVEKALSMLGQMGFHVTFEKCGTYLFNKN